VFVAYDFMMVLLREEIFLISFCGSFGFLCSLLSGGSGWEGGREIKSPHAHHEKRVVAFLVCVCLMGRRRTIRSDGWMEITRARCIRKTKECAQQPAATKAKVFLVLMLRRRKGSAPPPPTAKMDARAPSKTQNHFSHSFPHQNSHKYFPS
jgi:hypothetical protein